MKISLFKLLLLLPPIVLLAVQCSTRNESMNSGVFTKTDIDRKEYQSIAKLWGLNEVGLISRSDKVGILGTDYLLCVERVFNSKDTISYAIRTHAMGCKNPIVYKDTLYLYYDNPGMFTVTTGWYKGKLGTLDNSLSCIPANDSANQQKLKSIFGGIYKWEGARLIKISDDADSTFQAIEDNKESGIFYVPPPGIGVKYKYNIKLLTHKLANAKKREEAPDYLNNPF